MDLQAPSVPLSEPVRLAKRVAELKACSRSEAERYIEGGWVQVDRVVVEEPAFKVLHQTVVIDPHATLLDHGPITLLVHKPVGYQSGLDTGDGRRARPLRWALDLVTAGNRAAGDRSGTCLLKKHLVGLTALLPLAPEASGLVVFSQDWRIARKLTDDADRVEQEVMAQVRGEVSPDQLQRLAHGLSFNGVPLPPIKVSVGSSGGGQTRLRFALKGVRPGQVPFMCEAVGLQLLALVRIRIGRVALAGMEPGQWRYLPGQERF